MSSFTIVDAEREIRTMQTIKYVNAVLCVVAAVTYVMTGGWLAVLATVMFWVTVGRASFVQEEWDGKIAEAYDADGGV